MKYLFITTLYCLNLNLLCFSQNLNVDVSIIWENNPIYLRSNILNETNIRPYLVITYKNNSSSNIYFKKIVSEKYNLISVDVGETMFLVTHATENFKKGNESITIGSDFNSNKFYVNLSNSSQRFSSNFVHTYKIISSGSESPKIISTNIELLNNILRKQYFLDKYCPTNQLIFFDSPNKKIISYLGVVQKTLKFKEPIIQNKAEFSIEKFKNEFCFLEKNGLYTQKIDLLPFLLVGGNYIFSLDRYKFKKYLEFYNSNYETNSKYIRINLPSLLNGYKLYTGSFRLKNRFCILENKRLNNDIIVGKRITE